jgi:hypothetical protein
MHNMKNKHMKSLLIGITTFIFSLSPLLAQKYSKSDYPRLFAATDSLLEAYLEFSYFRSNDEGTGIDPSVLEGFRSLFDASAMLDDELGPKFLNQPAEVDCKKYLSFEKRTLEDYIRVRTEYFSKGMTSVDVISSSVSFSNIDYGEVTIVLLKTTTATLKRAENSVIVKSEVPFAIAAYYDETERRMKIKNIIILNPPTNGSIPNYTHLNDKDLDFVPDNRDADRSTPGLKSGDGIPDDQELACLGQKKSRFSVDLAGVYSLNTISSLNSSDGLNAFENVADHTDRNIGITPGLSYSGIGAQLTLGYNLDRKARFSVATGIRFELINGEVTSDSISISYKGFDNQSGDLGYLRTINSLGGISEKISGQKIGIPLFIRYKKTFNSIMAGRLSIEGAVGTMFNLSWSGTSEFQENRFDYSGVYYFTNPATFIGVPQYSEYDLSNNFRNELGRGILLQRGFSETQINDILNSYYEKGYDVGINVRADESNENSVSTYSFKPSLGFVFQPTFHFKVAPKGYLSLGGFVSFMKFTNSELVDNYKITDARGQYNTLMNSISSYTDLQYSVQLGYRIEF